MEDATSLESLRYPIGRFIKPEAYNEAIIPAARSAIGALPSWLDVLIENLDAHQLDTAYRPGGWTVQQVIHHLADSHMNAYVRFKLALTEDQPVVKPYKEALWAETPEVASVPVNVSITLLHALHIRWLALMEAMSGQDWQRCYYHPEQQREVPLWEVAAMYAWHGRHHMEQIRGLRERMGW